MDFFPYNTQNVILVAFFEKVVKCLTVRADTFEVKQIFKKNCDLICKVMHLDIISTHRHITSCIDCDLASSYSSFYSIAELSF